MRGGVYFRAWCNCDWRGAPKHLYDDAMEEFRVHCQAVHAPRPQQRTMKQALAAPEYKRRVKYKKAIQVKGPFIARCDCGWSSGERAYLVNAQLEFRRHAASCNESRRKAME